MVCCDFCGRKVEDVSLLFQHGSNCICNNCVLQANEIIADRIEKIEKNKKDILSKKRNKK